MRKETSELHDVHSLQLMDKRTRNWTEVRRNRGEYFMRDAEWQTAMRMRYLVAPISDPFAQCECGDILSNKDFVVHALDCSKVKGDTVATRHKLVKNAFAHLLRQYGFTPDNHEPRFSDGRVFFFGLSMIQVSTSEKDLGFGTIGSKNSPIQNISKIGQITRPVGGGGKRG